MARQEVLAESFIVGDDPFSLTGRALLRDAARRGLAVRLLRPARPVAELDRLRRMHYNALHEDGGL